MPLIGKVDSDPVVEVDLQSGKVNGDADGVGVGDGGVEGEKKTKQKTIPVGTRFGKVDWTLFR